jgi:hypothetical protein
MLSQEWNDSHDQKTRGASRQFDELFRKENSINYELTKEIEAFS